MTTPPSGTSGNVPPHISKLVVYTLLQFVARKVMVAMLYHACR